MEATLERNLYGYTVETLPVTEDAKMAAEHLLRAYPEWQLRKAGVLDRVISLSQRLGRSIQSGDVDAIGHIRVNLRDSVNRMERMFGARDAEGSLVATSDMVLSGNGKTVALFRRN